MNILTHPVHTGYQYDLASTGHQFYSVPIPNSGEIFWDEMSRPRPKNYHLLPSIPDDPGKFDVALVHFHQGFEAFQDLDIPIIYKEHCIRSRFDVPSYYHERVSYFSFSNIEAASRWVLPSEKVHQKVIIGMGIDPAVYHGYRGDDGDVLMVCHRVATRPLRKGLKQVRDLGKKFAITLVGNDNQGIKGAIGPARNYSDLIEYYRRFKVFLNCSPFLGMSTLEAMAMGMPVVSFETINSSIVENKINGLVVRSVEEARAALREVLSNREFAKQLGQNARACIKKRFSPARFRERWNTLFDKVAYGYAQNSRTYCVS
jgi:hypothetical protein